MATVIEVFMRGLLRCAAHLGGDGLQRASDLSCATVRHRDRNGLEHYAEPSDPDA
jgi:hypothetical protein